MLSLIWAINLALDDNHLTFFKDFYDIILSFDFNLFNDLTLFFFFFFLFTDLAN